MRERKQTRRDLQAAERRQQILDAARKLFAEKGYHGTSVRELNKEVGVTDSLTYHYFPEGKLQILNSIVEEGQWQVLETDANRLFNEENSLRDALLIYIQLVYKIFKDNKEIYQIVLRENHLFEVEKWSDLFTSSQIFTQAMAALLTGFQEKGIIREMDVNMAFNQFSSQIKLTYLHWIITGVDFEKEYKEFNTEKIIDFTVQLWSSERN